jgi:hypothetical protein
MSDTTPHIGDTRPAPDLNVHRQDPQPLEPDRRDARIAELEAELASRRPVRDLRQYAERVEARNAELEHLAVENAELRRVLGLVQAGVDPESLLGQTVVTAAAADGVSDPAQVAALALTLRAELNGGASRKENHAD